MPRIRDLKDQQLYRIDKTFDYGIFSPLLNKRAIIEIVQEQWESMLHVALSLKQRTVPAHVVVQRLTSSYPSDRLSKAFTNLGRIIKTQYILRYLTDPELRRTVQRQLNKGEYRHKLPRKNYGFRWIIYFQTVTFCSNAPAGPICSASGDNKRWSQHFHSPGDAHGIWLEFHRETKNQP